MSTHAYEPDPQSGAGNCVCGAAERHIRHPHEFMRGRDSAANGSRTTCTCTRPMVDQIHIPFTPEGASA